MLGTGRQQRERIQRTSERGPNHRSQRGPGRVPCDRPGRQGNRHRLWQLPHVRDHRRRFGSLPGTEQRRPTRLRQHRHRRRRRVPATAGPVPLGAGEKATAITSGRYHTCAILESGDVRCWGTQLALPGQLEDIGDDEPASAGALATFGGDKAIAVSAGQTSTCALVESGDIWCWGGGVAARYSRGFSQTSVTNPDQGGSRWAHGGGDHPRFPARLRPDRQR